jgi:hypothetical protein
MTRDVLVRLSVVVSIPGGLRVVDGFLNNADLYVQHVSFDSRGDLRACLT